MLTFHDTLLPLLCSSNNALARHITIGLTLMAAIMPLGMNAQNDTLPPYVIIIDEKQELPEITEDIIWEKGLAIHFPQNISKLPENDPNLILLQNTCQQIANNQELTCRLLIIRGSASPEGPADNNRNLAHNRAAVISQFVANNLPTYSDTLQQLLIEQYSNEDYYGLTRMLQDCDWNNAERILKAMSQANNVPANIKKALRTLDNGAIWTRLNQRFFPELRASRVLLILSTIPTPETEPLDSLEYLEPLEYLDSLEYLEPLETLDSLESLEPLVPSAKGPYLSLHTNLLYDALAAPNIGAEAYLTHNISIAANWRYAWWNNDNTHRYWRTYGGYVAARYWLGRLAKEKPLTGHHLGIYGQMILYDFEWGGKGYLSGTPGKNMWANPTWAAGLEYGFALPVAPRLNIDFALGVGYMQGEYQIYQPLDQCYVWQATYMRRWFGPTKAEISLVWLLGKDNINLNTKKAAKAAIANLEKGGNL